MLHNSPTSPIKVHIAKYLTKGKYSQVKIMSALNKYESVMFHNKKWVDRPIDKKNKNYYVEKC